MRIFCPTHEASFETADAQKILCEITGHTLSSDFPHAEFWEFCCNCGTFSPSKLGRGEKARTVCFSCENEVSKRFLCPSCKIVSFECATQAKGRNYFVTPSGIEPECPGCRSITAAAEVVRHECTDIEAAIYIADGSCPFCLEKTVTVNGPARVTGDHCPQCQAPVVSGSAFCGQCKYQLRSDLPTEKLGTDITRPQLLGSFCPNCSTPITPGSGFCVECGQAVKSEMLPPPPPPPPPVSKYPEPVSTSTSTRKIFAGLIGGLFLLVLIVAGITSSINRNSSSTSTGDRTPLPAYTPSATNRNSSSNAAPMILPENVEQTYTGTIGAKRQTFSISLIRSGTQITGRAETPRSWDKLVGTIDSNGSFDLSGYERGDMEMNTGQYTGQVLGSGTITGRWSDGIKGSDFTAYK